MAPPSAPIAGVLETILYGGDIPALTSFYADTLGLRSIGGVDDLGASFRLPDGGVLLVFDPALAARPDRLVPSHGSIGPGHVAFTVPHGTLGRWADDLRARGLEIEQDLDWGEGSRSIYVRDPAGNSVEPVDGDPWPA
jgi:catechol 2,3-dioxygenase-like lactoylglutathione lyase family enzyme